MKRNSIYLIICFALMTLLTSVAQETANSTDVSQAQNPVYRRIEGCLAYNGVSYVLAVVSNGPKQYRVAGGNIEALRGMLGHTVEIDGMAGSNDPREMVTNWDQREATTGAGWYTITAERVSDVTSNCSYAGFEHPLSSVGAN